MKFATTKRYPLKLPFDPKTKAKLTGFHIHKDYLFNSSSITNVNEKVCKKKVPIEKFVAQREFGGN